MVNEKWMVEEVKKENNNLLLGELEKFKGKGKKWYSFNISLSDYEGKLAHGKLFISPFDF